MIKLRIKEILEQKGQKPKPYSLQKLGLTYRKAVHLLSGNAKSISFEDLELLCVNLFCTPKELLEVQIAENEINPIHPLHEWEATAIPKPIQKLYTLSPESNKELSEFVQLLEQKDIDKAKSKLE